MSILLCTICDTEFDPDIQVEAHYFPAICEDCLLDDALSALEEQLQQTWNQLDQDTQAIADFCEETP